jgi:hypothetical protein
VLPFGGFSVATTENTTTLARPQFGQRGLTSTAGPSGFGLSGRPGCEELADLVHPSVERRSLGETVASREGQIAWNGVYTAGRGDPKDLLQNPVLHFRTDGFPKDSVTIAAPPPGTSVEGAPRANGFHPCRRAAPGSAEVAATSVSTRRERRTTASPSTSETMTPSWTISSR